MLFVVPSSRIKASRCLVQVFVNTLNKFKLMASLHRSEKGEIHLPRRKIDCDLSREKRIKIRSGDEMGDYLTLF